MERLIKSLCGSYEREINTDQIGLLIPSPHRYIKVDFHSNFSRPKRVVNDEGDQTHIACYITVDNVILAREISVRESDEKEAHSQSAYEDMLYRILYGIFHNGMTRAKERIDKVNQSAPQP